MSIFSFDDPEKAKRSMSAKNTGAPLTLTNTTNAGFNTQPPAPPTARSKNADLMQSGGLTAGVGQPFPSSTDTGLAGGAPVYDPNAGIDNSAPSIPLDTASQAYATLSGEQETNPNPGGDLDNTVDQWPTDANGNPLPEPTDPGDPDEYQSYEYDDGKNGHEPGSGGDVGDTSYRDGRPTREEGQAEQERQDAWEQYLEELHGRHTDGREETSGLGSSSVDNIDENGNTIDENGNPTNNNSTFGNEFGMDPLLAGLWEDQLNQDGDPSAAQENLEQMVMSQLGDAQAGNAARLGAYGGGRSGALGAMNMDQARQAGLQIGQGQYNIGRQAQQDALQRLGAGTSALHEQQRLGNEQEAFDIQKKMLEAALDDPDRANLGMVSDSIRMMFGDSAAQQYHDLLESWGFDPAEEDGR